MATSSSVLRKHTYKIIHKIRHIIPLDGPEEAHATDANHGGPDRIFTSHPRMAQQTDKSFAAVAWPVRLACWDLTWLGWAWTGWRVKPVGVG